MKKFFSLIVVILSLVLTACGSQKKNPNAVPFEIVPAASSGDSPAPEVATTLPDVLPTAGDTGGDSPSASASEIVLTDNGKTFTYHVGDSFLLDLGTDVYDWEVTIADQTIFRMKMGVMVIQGAQGIYDALAPGTAALTAVGTPQCLKSSPPCGMPTILFKVTLIVQ